MISQIRTASRLHFGLLALPESDAENSASESKRFWGGIGLMIEEPGIELSAEPANDWKAEGSLSHRVLEFAQRFRERCKASTRIQPLKFHVRSHPPEHCGFGTGTQLGLVTARLIAEHCDLVDKSAPTLAKLVGRGKRSAIGIHGFDVGGFLVEGGKTKPENISPLVARHDFPDDWRVVLISPGQISNVHGAHELQAFQELRSNTSTKLPTRDFASLILLALLPALVEEDCETFGNALTEFNWKVGAAFAPVQGGVYSHPMGEEIVDFVQGEGISGIAQSSWGPTLAAITDSMDRAIFLKERVEGRYPELAGVCITRARNFGAEKM